MIDDRNEDNFSSLGTTPICDICKKELKIGDKICQSFTGVVRNMLAEFPNAEPELAVDESINYSVIHIDCVKVN